MSTHEFKNRNLLSNEDFKKFLLQYRFDGHCEMAKFLHELYHFANSRAPIFKDAHLIENGYPDFKDFAKIFSHSQYAATSENVARVGYVSRRKPRDDEKFLVNMDSLKTHYPYIAKLENGTQEQVLISIALVIAKDLFSKKDQLLLSLEDAVPAAEKEVETPHKSKVSKEDEEEDVTSEDVVNDGVATSSGEKNGDTAAVLLTMKITDANTSGKDDAEEVVVVGELETFHESKVVEDDEKAEVEVTTTASDDGVTGDCTTADTISTKDEESAAGRDMSSPLQQDDAVQRTEDQDDLAEDDEVDGDKVIVNKFPVSGSEDEHQDSADNNLGGTSSNNATSKSSEHAQPSSSSEKPIASSTISSTIIESQLVDGKTSLRRGKKLSKIDSPRVSLAKVLNDVKDEDLFVEVYGKMFASISNEPNADVLSTSDTAWVNESLVNVFVYVLRSLLPKQKTMGEGETFILPTNFLSKSMGGGCLPGKTATGGNKTYDYETCSFLVQMERTKAKDNILGEKWIVPTPHGGHWIAVIVDLKERSINLYDSLEKPKELEVFNSVKEHIFTILKELDSGFTDQGWSTVYAPQASQEDSDTCGIFVIVTIIQMYLYGKTEMDQSMIYKVRSMIKVAFEKETLLQKVKDILHVMDMLDPNKVEQNLNSVQDADSEHVHEDMGVDKKPSPTISSSSTTGVEFKDRNLADLRCCHFGFAPTEETGDVNKWLQTGVSSVQEKCPLPEQGAKEKNPRTLFFVPTDVGNVSNVAGVSFYSKRDQKYDVYLGHDLSSDEKTMLRSRVLILKQLNADNHQGVVNLNFTAIYRNGVMVETSEKEAKLHCTPFLSFTALNILTPFLCRHQHKSTVMFNIYDYLHKFNYPSPELFSEENKEEKVNKPFRFLPEYSLIKEAMKKKTNCFNIKDQTSWGGFVKDIEAAIKKGKKVVTKDLLSRRDIILKFYTPVEALMKKKTRGTPGRPSASNPKRRQESQEQKELRNIESQRNNPELFFQMTAWNLMLTALLKCPIPLEAAAISIYGFNECIPLLKESLNVIKGNLIFNAQRITLPKKGVCIFPLKSFREKLGEATTSLVEKAAELPWEELYSSFNHFLNSDQEQKLTIDVFFFTYIHQILVGDAFEMEKGKKKVGPIYRDQIHLLAKGIPAILAETQKESIGKKSSGKNASGPNKKPKIS